MSTTTLIPVAEYLNTSYRPDCDFLEGELRERNMGERPHAVAQGYLVFLFRLKRDAWGVLALPEQRVQIGAERYRVPDICVIRSTDNNDPIVRTPPLLCIEVLSKHDPMGEIQERVDDYFRMGVQHVWAIDPWKRLAYYCSPSGFQQPADGVLRIEGTPIEVPLSNVFAELDSQTS